MLTHDQIKATGAWIARHQTPDGEIPWWRGHRADPWDHVHSAMGLVLAGYMREASLAFRFLQKTQLANGAWIAQRRCGKVFDDTRDTNQTAYVATGVWYRFCIERDTAFVAEMWPVVERAIDFVVELQNPTGDFAWAMSRAGEVHTAPLITGSSSIHGSLVCAIRIAEHLGYHRPKWHEARARVAHAIQNDIDIFDDDRLPDPQGRFSMDWYYPVLGGALRGEAGRARLLDPELITRFVGEGVGCRCVRDSPWYTLAETCELILAYDACGLRARAGEIESWVRRYRMDDGGYYTGTTWPEGIFWPPESNTYTSAAVLMADDALHRNSVTSDFFHTLTGDDLGTPDSRHAIAS